MSSGLWLGWPLPPLEFFLAANEWSIALQMRGAHAILSSRAALLAMGLAMRITRLIEEPDWRNVLPEIDTIFFATSAVQTFRDDHHRASFRMRWLGKYLEYFTGSFFIARDDDGTIAGYLAGCLENPALTPVFKDFGVYRIFAPLCDTYPCHLHVNVHAHFRSRGVGSALMQAFVTDARDHYAPGLHVVTDRGANVQFYERNQFRTLGATRWSGKDVLFMGRRLISRNEQCPCGSGRKFKHCHGAIVPRCPTGEQSAQLQKTCEAAKSVG
jgi:GNAT superfamily N-acetyltransferase